MFDECKCDCHEPNNHVSHIMPCCEQCPSCELKIKFGYDKHVEKCKADHIASLEERLARPLTEEEKKLLFN